MQASKLVFRRNFVGTTALAAGLSAVSAETSLGQSPDLNQPREKLPREVWIATTSQHELGADTSRGMAQLMLDVLKKSKAFLLT